MPDGCERMRIHYLPPPALKKKCRAGGVVSDTLCKCKDCCDLAGDGALPEPTVGVGCSMGCLECARFNATLFREEPDPNLECEKTQKKGDANGKEGVQKKIERKYLPLNKVPDG